MAVVIQLWGPIGIFQAAKGLNYERMREHVVEDPGVESRDFTYHIGQWGSIVSDFCTIAVLFFFLKKVIYIVRRHGTSRISRPSTRIALKGYGGSNRH